MRRTRWLLLVVIAAILGGVGATYHLQKLRLLRSAPERPAQLPLDLSALSTDWEWTKTEHGRPLVNIRAKSVQQSKGAGRTDLAGVQLRIFHKDGLRYDLVKSASAWFAESERLLHSEGEVEITLGVPLEGEPERKLVTIRSSGVVFNTNTGQASTEKPAEFYFENGMGKSVGASYDPTIRELRMASQVEVNWKGPDAQQAMKLESGELLYKEDGSTVYLQPWSRLTRDQSIINAGPAVVTLNEGEVQLVEAQKAVGEDRRGGRLVQFGGDHLWVHFGPQTEVHKVEAQRNAHVTSTADASVTRMNADRIDLEFAAETVLTKAQGNGNAAMTSEPRAQPGRQTPATRVLRSNTIHLLMRDGGREVEQVETHAPGTLEFLPNRKEDRKRKLSAFRMSIQYGEANRLKVFRAVQDVATETLPPAAGPEKGAPVTHTKSGHLSAEFDPQTGQMMRMEQWENFQYEAGTRKAQADRAVLDSKNEAILLENKARVWDPDGSTSADRIRMNQANGDVLAEGRVNSSRVSEKASPAGALLAGDQPLQAIARTMSTANRNRLVHYEGDVVLWQGANRLLAQSVDIDRGSRTLHAEGGVSTQFREESKNRAGTAAEVFTTVKAPKLVYTEENRLAHYTGGTVLNRPGLEVKSTELRAFLTAGGESRLDRAVADGSVEIVQVAGDRTRKGTGEHGEYYVSEEKVILRGGDPQLADSQRGQTRGAELTYWANDDRLLVTGAPGKPVSTRIRRN